MIIETVMGTAISSVGMYSSGPTRSFLIWVSLDENVCDNHDDNKDKDVENSNHNDNKDSYVENYYHDDNEDNDVENDNHDDNADNDVEKDNHHDNEGNDVENDNHGDNEDNDVESLMQIYLFSSITLLHPPHHPAPPANILVMKVKVKVNLPTK